MPVLNDRDYIRSATYAVAGTNITGPFAIPFPFWDKDSVRVFIDGQEIFTFWIDQADIFGTEGNLVWLESPISTSEVTIWSQTGSFRSTGDTFTQAELSKEIDRVFGNMQEMWQRGIWLDSTGNFDAGGNRIINVGDPVDPGDAANKRYVDAQIEMVLAILEREIGGVRELIEEFRQLYLGAKAQDPATDNQGQPLIVGAMYYNLTVDQLRVWDGAAWRLMSDTVVAGTTLPPLGPEHADHLVTVNDDATDYVYRSFGDMHEEWELGEPVTQPAGISFILSGGSTYLALAGGMLKFGRTSDELTPLYAPFDCALTAAGINNLTNALGGNTNIRLSINDGAPILIWALPAGFQDQHWTNPQNLPIAISAGDKLEFTYDCDVYTNQPSLTYSFFFSAANRGGPFSVPVYGRMTAAGTSVNYHFGDDDRSGDMTIPVDGLLLKTVTVDARLAPISDITYIVRKNGTEVASGVLPSGTYSLVFDVEELFDKGDSIDIISTAVGATGTVAVDMTLGFEDQHRIGAPNESAFVRSFNEFEDLGLQYQWISPVKQQLTGFAVTSQYVLNTQKTFSIYINAEPERVVLVHTADPNNPIFDYAAIDPPIYLEKGDVVTVETNGVVSTGLGGTLHFMSFVEGTQGVLRLPMPPVAPADAGKHLAVNDTGTELFWDDAGQADGAAEVHPFWRVRMTSTGSTGGHAIGEVEFRDRLSRSLTAGNPSPAFASSTLAGSDPGNAFDNSVTTAWQSENPDAGPWLAYGWDVQVAPWSVRLQAPPSNPSEMFLDFDLEWSDDGTNWTLMQSFTGVSAWAADEWRTFWVTQSDGGSGSPGPAGTSVRFGNDTTTANAGDIYYHENGNIYLISAPGQPASGQTLMGSWQATGGWEPYGGVGTDPLFWNGLAPVQEFVTPDFEAGFDYQLRWDILGNLVNNYVLMRARYAGGTWLSTPAGGGHWDITSPGLRQIGRADFLNPMVAQRHLRISGAVSRVSNGAADTYAYLSYTPQTVFSAGADVAWNKAGVRVNAGTITGTARLYRRATNVES